MNIPKIDIVIAGVVYENTFARDILIDKTNIEDEFLTQPQKYHYYSYLAEEAKSKAAIKKFEVEQLYARIDFEKRHAANSLTGNPHAKIKYTEKMCENEVITDKRYSDAFNELLEMQRLANQLEKCAVSFAQRRDMLIQLGGNLRQTMQPQRLVDQQVATMREVMGRKPLQQALPMHVPPPAMPPSLPFPESETLVFNENEGGIGPSPYTPTNDINIIAQSNQPEIEAPQPRRRRRTNESNLTE